MNIVLKKVPLLCLVFLAVACGNKQEGGAAESSLLDHTTGTAQIDFNEIAGLSCTGSNSRLEMDRSEGGTFLVTAAADNQKDYYQEVGKVRRVWGYRNWKRVTSANLGTLAYINQADLRAITWVRGRWQSQTCEVKIDQPAQEDQVLICTAEEGDMTFKIGVDYQNEIASFNRVNLETNTSELVDDKAKVTLRRSGLEGMVTGMQISARSTPDYSDGSCWDWVETYHLNFAGVGLPQDGDLTLSRYPKTNRQDCPVPEIHFQPFETKIICENAEAEPPRMCTAIAGTLYNPETEQCQGFTNGCRRAEMIAAGFQSPAAGQCGRS